MRTKYRQFILRIAEDGQEEFHPEANVALSADRILHIAVIPVCISSEWLKGECEFDLLY
jgi:hypothetical protein